jgi:hypothetical protein
VFGIRDVFSSKTTYIEYELYKLMQMIEILAREFYGGKYCADNEFEHIMSIVNNSMLSINNEKIKTRIRNSIENSNEFTLRDKTIQLINDIRNNTSWDVSVNVKKCVNDAVTIRNDLTHYSKPFRHKFSIDRYVELCCFFKKIMWAALLFHVGFSWELIEKRVLKNPFFT